MSVTFNAGTYLVDRHVLEGRGSWEAFRCGDQRVTYADLAALVTRVHGGLDALGVVRGDRVMFFCSDRIELVAGLLGCFRHGAIAVPVSTMLTGPELAKLVVDSGARVLVVSPEFTDAVGIALSAVPAPSAVVTLDHASVEGVPTISWEVRLQPGPGQAADTQDDDIALWLYTSGTTGTPKAAMHRHGSIRAVCQAYGRDVLAISPDDVCFSAAKVFFAYGLGNSVLFPLSVGATTVVDPRRPSPDGVADIMRSQRPTLFFAGPTFLAALLNADLPADTFASVRLALSAGEALPATLLKRFHDRFGVQVLDGIGSTEALHIFLSNRVGEVRAGTSGRPVEGYEVELRDETGARVRDGQPGALFVKGPSLAAGYWQRAEATAAVFQGDWLSTGDSYVQSPDGYYTCLGRSNDLIKAGGIWLSPAEVEDRLLQHPSVAEAAVVGVPDSNDLDKPVAFVVVRSGTVSDAAELEAWCRETLAAFKRPRAFVFLDALPKTATGKVQRFRLCELAGEQLFTAP